MWFEFDVNRYHWSGRSVSCWMAAIAKLEVHHTHNRAPGKKRKPENQFHTKYSIRFGLVGDVTRCWYSVWANEDVQWCIYLSVSMIAIAFVCLFISKFKPLASIERVLLLAFIWCSCEFRRFHFAIAIFQCVHIGQISIGFICRGSIPTLLSHRIRPPSSIRHHQQMHRSDASCISLEISCIVLLLYLAGWITMRLE